MAQLTKARDKEFIPQETPIEIDAAVEAIRMMLKQLPWVSHAFHLAQRFYEKVDGPDGKAFYYPETYIPNPQDKNYSYHKLTPDNGYTGMFFFMAGMEKNDFTANQFNFLTTPISIIFSVNMELIDKDKLKLGLFTQELIQDVRRLLTTGGLGLDFQYKLKTVTRDLREVYKEFILDDLKQYNRAPLQCFRFELDITVKEQCS